MATNADHNLPDRQLDGESPRRREFVTTVSPVSSRSSVADEIIEQRLHELGGESDTERKAKRIAPFIASVMIHLGVVLIALIIAGSVILIKQDEQAMLIVADFDDLRYDPVVRLDVERSETTERIVQDRVPVENLMPSLAEQLADIDVDPLSVISDASSQSPMAEFAADPTTNRVQFSGLSSSNARRIVYVIDASGSMIRSLQYVVDELARSIDALSPQQRVGIVFFQGNEALIVPPNNELVSATGAQKLRMLQWIDQNVFPRGGSNPVNALRYALQRKPDVVFVLSENITGGGKYEIDQRDLLAMLDELNPIIDETTGRRQTQINGIQFLEKDPLDTLRHIAEIHGGPRGYKFLNREELGLAAPR